MRLGELSKGSKWQLGLAVGIVLSILLSTPFSYAQSSTSEFQSANSAISGAYLQIYRIQQNGGNVTALDARLNVAIGLYNNALGENQTNPSQAEIDLQNATQIANSLYNEATPLVHRAERSNQQRLILMGGEVFVTLVAAILLYAFGERVYDMLWFHQRKSYVVKRRNG